MPKSRHPLDILQHSRSGLLLTALALMQQPLAYLIRSQSRSKTKPEPTFYQHEALEITTLDTASAVPTLDLLRFPTPNQPDTNPKLTLYNA